MILVIMSNYTRILQIGCNYHTTWQSNKAVKLVLIIKNIENV